MLTRPPEPLFTMVCSGPRSGPGTLLGGCPVGLPCPLELGLPGWWAGCFWMRPWPLSTLVRRKACTGRRWRREGGAVEVVAGAAPSLPVSLRAEAFPESAWPSTLLPGGRLPEQHQLPPFWPLLQRDVTSGATLSLVLKTSEAPKP